MLNGGLILLVFASVIDFHKTRLDVIAEVIWQSCLIGIE